MKKRHGQEKKIGGIFYNDKNKGKVQISKTCDFELFEHLVFKTGDKNPENRYEQLPLYILLPSAK